MMATFRVCSLLLVASLATASAWAQQAFTATVGGQAWASDHDGITVVPVETSGGNGTVTIRAVTKGFSGWPTPKGFPDAFSIVCPLLRKAEKVMVGVTGNRDCRVSFIKAERNMMSPDYKTTKNEGKFESISGGDGFVNFTRVQGKTIEGEFSAELVDARTKTKLPVSGKFKGLDEQVGSKGFN